MLWHAVHPAAATKFAPEAASPFARSILSMSAQNALYFSSSAFAFSRVFVAPSIMLLSPLV